jgi:DNA-binding response OmpR family regulator
MFQVEWTLPEVEGLELIRELRTMDKRVRIIAISGSMRALPKTFLPIAQHFGALRTLEKPFSAQELLELIEEVLASGGDACER